MNAEPIIDAQTYARVMRIVSPLLALSFWFLTIWFLQYGRKSGVWRRFVGMCFWTLNVAVFWTTLAYWRLATGSVPTPWIQPINFWSSVIYFQAAFSMMFGLIFLRHASLPAGTDSYSSPEIGPDDIY